jgi:hypothetical protein
VMKELGRDEEVTGWPKYCLKQIIIEALYHRCLLCSS